MEPNNEKIQTLMDWVNHSDRVVFFGGAGVSTESGIPDFRSVDGLYNQKYDYPPEEIISHSFFRRNTGEFYRFYRDKLIYEDAKPSTTHLALAKLEEEGKLQAVITQNIDGLHQLAGSKNVIELHGTVLKNHCMDCGAFYPGHEIITKAPEGETTDTWIPRCPKCNGIIKPDVVLYEEGLDENDITRAIRAIAGCDVLIVGGTSLGVYPAAGMINYYQGKKLVRVNLTPTPFDHKADLLIHEKLGEVFSHFLT